MLRRSFLKSLGFIALGAAGCLEPPKKGIPEESSLEKSQVFVIRTQDRQEGVRELVKDFSPGLRGKKVAMKANFNSADPFPASTHLDTLSALVDSLEGAELTMAERSGMGDTGEVLESTGVMELAEQKGFEVVVLDEQGEEEWDRVEPRGSHWDRGYLFPRVFSRADAIVQTCCLKTHRYGGHFTMSLKNSVGMVAEEDEGGYNYMSELHGSPYQREMIAEINQAYEPEFTVMDGIEGFSTGGPAHGTLIEPEVMLAGRDRVALDAAGVAVLKLYGTTPEVEEKRVFQQDQIARAVELGLGASSPGQVEMVPVNREAEGICSQIKRKLGEEGV